VSVSAATGAFAVASDSRLRAEGAKSEARSLDPASSSDVQIVAGLLKRHRTIALTAASVLLTIFVAGVVSILRRPASGATTSQPEGSSPSVADFEVIQLTTTGNASRPAISPDGRYVAYVQQDGTSTSLWIRQVATESNVQIVPALDGTSLTGVTVTPDGNFVDFVRSPQGTPPALWRVPFLGGDPRKLVDRIHSSIGWAPDGRRFAFIRSDNASGEDRLIIADAEGGTERILTTRRRPALFFSHSFVTTPNVRPAWSPDGTRIALHGSSSFRPELAIVNAASGSAQSIPLGDAVNTSFPSGLIWLDERSLVMGRAPEFGAPQQLWRISYPDGVVTRLTNDLNHYLGISGTSDGGTMATARSEVRVSLSVGDSAARVMREVVSPFPANMPSYQFAWAGERLLYPVSMQGRTSIRSLIPDPGAKDREALANGFGPAATTDGKNVVYVSPDRRIWRVDGEGRQATELFQGFPVGLLVTSDDRYVVFLSGGERIQSPWILPMAGGQATPVSETFVGVGQLDVSAKSNRIVFVTPTSTGQATVICDLPKCTSRTELPTTLSIPRWTPDGETIAYLPQPRVNIWVQRLDGSKPRQLTNSSDDRPIVDYRWSRDGKRLAIARSSVTNDIVLFKGLKR
jgi:Tol biopolymer transport system component